MTTQSAPSFVLEFTKMSGAGNDFIVIDNRFYRFTDDELSGFAGRFCARRTGVGADGLLALNLASEPESVSYRMKYFNADGSLGTMCGNGARCLARFAVAAGVHRTDLDNGSGSHVRFESDAGDYFADVPDDPSAHVRVYVPEPTTPLEERTVAYVDVPVYTLHTGTQHAVLFVDDVAGCDVPGVGPRIRRDESVAAGGTNVNFVEAADRRSLRVRTWEKGVEGETLACGTGAIASALTAAARGLIDGNRVEIHATGGILVVGWDGTFDRPEGLYLEGAADVIYRGSVEL
ncbi:MAG: diaminopimelate epimerase [Rhodothermales bacterium]|nr:diaminopimelate epimerase [Rhodothermales bacterium]